MTSIKLGWYMACELKGFGTMSINDRYPMCRATLGGLLDLCVTSGNNMRTKIQNKMSNMALESGTQESC